MICKDIEGKLAAYQEEALSPEEKSLVEAHLGTCAKCSSLLADLKKTVDLLKDLPEVEPPPWFTQKIMAQVREESEQKGGLLRKLFYPFHIKIPIEAFATLLVVVIGVHIFRATVPEIRTVVQAPQAEIQQTAPPEAPLKEPTRITKDALETKGRADFLAPPAREKAVTSLPPAGKLSPTEHEQGPAAPAPSVSGMAIEKKQEGIREAPRLQQEPASTPAPLAKEKEAFSAAGAAQKDKGESKKLGAAQPSKSALAVKRAVTTLSVQVTDVQAAILEIERILTGMGAKSITRDSRDGIVYIAAQLQTERTVELLQQLSTVGIVQQKDISKESKEDSTLFRIEVTRNN
jgi:hypothetical protein